MKKSIDKEILYSLKSGDHKAFHSIFLAYFGKIKFFICSFVKSQEEAEELAQDVFMKLWENRAQIDPGKSFDSYLYTMTRNTAFNFLKHKLVENAYSEQVYCSEPDFAQDPETIWYARELELLIAMKVEQMPEKRKEIFKLSRHKGLSNEEIAQTLSISKKTVENQLSLALSELKKSIVLFILLCQAFH